MHYTHTAEKEFLKHNVYNLAKDNIYSINNIKYCNAHFLFTPNNDTLGNFDNLILI